MSSKPNSVAKAKAPAYTAIKMDKRLFKKAKQRAKKLHQTYSDYVRQLIVRDLEPAA